MSGFNLYEDCPGIPIGRKFTPRYSSISDFSKTQRRLCHACGAIYAVKKDGALRKHRRIRL